jgi:hypothetical protein
MRKRLAVLLMTVLLLAAMAAPASANVFNGPNGEQTCRSRRQLAVLDSYTGFASRDEGPHRSAKAGCPGLLCVASPASM